MLEHLQRGQAMKKWQCDCGRHWLVSNPFAASCHSSLLCPWRCHFSASCPEAYGLAAAVCEGCLATLVICLSSTALEEVIDIAAVQ